MNSPIASRLAFAAAFEFCLFAMGTPAGALEGEARIAEFFGVEISEFDTKDPRKIYYTETLRNTTGQDANDLHVDIRSAEDYVVWVSSNEFLRSGQKQVSGSNDVTADLSGAIPEISDGVVPAGETVRVSWTVTHGGFRVTETRIRSHFFTSDGEPIGAGESPNLSVGLEAATGGVNVLLQNHGSQTALIGGEVFTADSTVLALRDLGRLNTDPALRSLKNYTSYDIFGASIQPGQAVIALFLPDRRFSEPPSSGEFAASAGVVASMHEGEEAAILAGERLMGLALFNVSNGTNLAFGIRLVPEPATTSMILTLGGALLLRRKKRRQNYFL